MKKKYIILFSLLFIAFSLLSVSFLVDNPDYYWHFKAGEYMVCHHTILTKDIFSWYLHGKYWFSHEWLFEVIIYLLYMLFGNYNVAIYCFICVLLLNFSIFLPNRDGYLKNIPFSLLWIMLSSVLFLFLQGRPQLISYILLSVVIYIMYDIYNNQDSKLYLFIPIISLIWVNTHGGSSNLVYLIPLLFIISGLFNFKSSKIEARRISKKQLYKYILCIILGFSFLFINPHGYKMIIYPYSNMMDSTMINNISEWRSSSLNDLQHYPYFILSFIIFIVMLISKKKLRMIDFILYLFGLFMGLKSIRFWAFIYIIMSHSIWYYVNPRKYDKGTSGLLITLSIIFIIMFAISIPRIGNMHQKMLKDEAVDTLKKEKPKRLFNYYDYGGYLIYKDIDVFIDGRADLYSKYNYRDYLDISRLSYNYDKLIDKYNFDYYLVPRKSGITTYLKDNINYIDIYSDKKVEIYKKVKK